MKYCNKCDQYKDFKEFGKNKNMNDGLIYYCKNCLNKNQTKIRKTAKSKFYQKEYQIQYRENNKK